MINSRLQFYLLYGFLKIWIYLSLIFTLLSLLIDFSQNALQSSNYSQSSILALQISFLRLPFLLEQILPFISLIASLLFFLQKNRNNELIALRSLGFSIWQFLAPLALASFFIALASITLLNPLSCFCLKKAKILQHPNKSLVEFNNNNLQQIPWLLQSQDNLETEIRAEFVDKKFSRTNLQFLINELKDQVIKNKAEQLMGSKLNYIKLQNADFIFITKNNSSNNIKWLRCKTAILLQDYWLLLNNKILESQAQPVIVNAYLFPTKIKPEFLQSYIIDPNLLSFYELPEKMKMAQIFGYQSNNIKIIFNKLISLPFALISMLIIAAAMSVDFSRDNNNKLNSLYTLLLGFFLYIITNILQNFAKIAIISPFTAIWLPNFIAICYGLAFLFKKEDG